MFTVSGVLLSGLHVYVAAVKISVLVIVVGNLLQTICNASCLIPIYLLICIQVLVTNLLL